MLIVIPTTTTISTTSINRIKWIYSIFCILIFSWQNKIPAYFFWHICRGDMRPFLSIIVVCSASFCISCHSSDCHLSLVLTCPRFTVGLLHALPLAFSVIFYSFTSLASTCMFIILYVYLFACPSPHTHTHMAPACLGIQSFLLLLKVLKVSNLHLPMGPHPYLMKESSELHSS